MSSWTTRATVQFNNWNYYWSLNLYTFLIHFVQIWVCYLFFLQGIQPEREYFRTSIMATDIYSVEEVKDLLQYCFGELLCTCILVTVFLRLFPLTTKTIPTNKKALKEIQMQKYIHALFVGLTIVALQGGMWVDIILYSTKQTCHSNSMCQA